MRALCSRAFSNRMVSGIIRFPRPAPAGRPPRCGLTASSIGAIYGQMEKEHLKSETDESWRIAAVCS